MYSIDGVPLQNPGYGWQIRKAGTTPAAPLSRNLIDFNTSGRDGTVQVRGYTGTPTVTFVIGTPTTRKEALRALFLYGASLTFTADPSRAQKVELVSLTEQTLALPGDGVYEITAVLRCPDVYWRDVSPSDDGPFTIGSSGETVRVLGASTAPVRDALVCVQGGITNPQINGAGGTYLNWSGTLGSSTFLTFDCNSGRAWTGASEFALGTEVTSAVGNGRGPYFLELAGSSDPANPGLPIGLAGASFASPTITVRARNAYNR